MLQTLVDGGSTGDAVSGQDTLVALSDKQLALDTHGKAQKQNGPQPLILRLPAELLSRMFLDVYEEINSESMWENGFTSKNWVFSTTHVCHVWRSTALECTNLWTSIPTCIGENWARAFVARSKAATLSISVSHDVSTWQYALVRDNISRIKELELCGAPASAVAAYFDLAKAYVPAQLVKLTLQPRSVYTVKQKHAHLLLQTPLLEEIVLGDISIPWNMLPWNRLRRVEVVLGSPNSVMTDFKELIASLASAPLLEDLRLNTHKCSFKAASTKLAPAHLPLLGRLIFEGFAAEFKRLTEAMRMPGTARLIIILHSDRRSAAEPSILAPLLRRQSGHVEHEPHGRIRAMKMSVKKRKNLVNLQAWQSQVDLESDEPPARFIDLYLHLPEASNTFNFNSVLAALCTNIKLDWLCQLRMPDSRVEGDKAWDMNTWQRLFSSAKRLEYIRLEGCYLDGVFQAISTPLNASPPASDQDSTREARSLFPSLRHIYMSSFQVEPLENDGQETTDLCMWLEARARHAPIATLTIRKSSFEDDEMEQLKQISGLEVDWDESYGMSSDDEDNCKECGGIGCFECRSSDYMNNGLQFDSDESDDW